MHHASQVRPEHGNNNDPTQVYCSCTMSILQSSNRCSHRHPHMPPCNSQQLQQSISTTPWQSTAHSLSASHTLTVPAGLSQSTTDGTTQLFPHSIMHFTVKMYAKQSQKLSPGQIPLLLACECKTIRYNRRPRERHSRHSSTKNSTLHHDNGRKPPAS